MAKIRKDITGQRFGALVALRPVPASECPDGRVGWLCRCDCGREKVVNGNNLRSGKITSCGCHMERGKRRSLTPNRNPIVDYTGQTFYELTAIKRVGAGTWLFRCSCGKEVTARPATVKSGKIRSCGHILSETARDKMDRDGLNVVQHYDGTIITRLRHIISSPEVHGVKPVTTANGGKKYVARLTMRRKQLHLGRFDTYEEAVIARRNAEQVYYVPLIEEYDKLHKEDNSDA